MYTIHLHFSMNDSRVEKSSSSFFTIVLLLGFLHLRIPVNGIFIGQTTSQFHKICHGIRVIKGYVQSSCTF